MSETIKLLFARVLYFLSIWFTLASFYTEGFIWDSEIFTTDLFFLILFGIISIICGKYALKKTKEKNYDYGLMGGAFIFWLIGCF